MSHCSFHSNKKEGLTVVYGNAELYEKKKITNFLINHDVDFLATDQKNNVYEAIIKV